eukprot:2416053-Prorocentrum_lima.AAC.1
MQAHHCPVGSAQSFRGAAVRSNCGGLSDCGRSEAARGVCGEPPSPSATPMWHPLAESRGASPGAACP